jgi:hypothetical protein
MTANAKLTQIFNKVINKHTILYKPRPTYLMLSILQIKLGGKTV